MAIAKANVADSEALPASELELLRESQRTVNGGGDLDKLLVDVVVNGCAYSCCGRGWQRRDGYEQTYRGWVDNLELPEGEAVGTFMLYSPGIGTISYVVAVRFDEVQEVRDGQS